MPEERRPFLLIAWALLFGLFVWTIRPVLTPIVLFLTLAYVLWPLFGTAIYRRLMVTLGALTFLWLLYVAGGILTPFVLGFIFAYIASPLVTRLEGQGVGRGWGALLVMAVTVLSLAVVVVLLLPLALEQGQQFLDDLPRMIEDGFAWYRAQLRRLAESRTPLIDQIPFERGLEVEASDVQRWIVDRMAELSPSWQTAVGVGQGVTAALTILGYLVLTPVLAFYLMRDLPGVSAWVEKVLPPDRQEGMMTFLRRYDELVGEYLRGQLLVALMVGIATAIGFWVVGFPNAILLGVVAGVFNIVPYLGLVVSLIPALLIALVTPPIWISLLKVAGVFFAVQSLDGYLISPRIIGERVGLHPVWVMLAIIVAGSFFGLVGLLLAIPAAVLVKLILRNSLLAYKKSVYYREAASLDDEPEV